MPTTQTDVETPPEPRVAATIPDIRRLVAQARQDGRRVGIVPTMGALHEGHLSLIRAARANADFVVVTIFVNPTQFAPDEDFSDYPRTMDSDLAACRQLGVDSVFYPSNAEIYSDHATTVVNVTGLSTILEGRHRPTHFAGVTTVVLKLFNIVAPDIAWFGQKDYQQQLIIRRMCADLDVPIEIVTSPTVREPDGLALSSRNRYLAGQQRQSALLLFQSLQVAERRILSGDRDIQSIRKAMHGTLSADTGVRVDYATIVNPETLDEVDEPLPRMVALVAARVGSTRLIDNLLINSGRDAKGLHE